MNLRIQLQPAAPTNTWFLVKFFILISFVGGMTMGFENGHGDRFIPLMMLLISSLVIKWVIDDTNQNELLPKPKFITIVLAVFIWPFGIFSHLALTRNFKSAFWTMIFSFIVFMVTGTLGALATAALQMLL